MLVDLALEDRLRHRDVRRLPRRHQRGLVVLTRQCHDDARLHLHEVAHLEHVASVGDQRVPETIGNRFDRFPEHHADVLVISGEDRRHELLDIVAGECLLTLVVEARAYLECRTQESFEVVATALPIDQGQRRDIEVASEPCRRCRNIDA
jgi:hypothetical protein